MFRFFLYFFVILGDPMLTRSGKEADQENNIFRAQEVISKSGVDGEIDGFSRFPLSNSYSFYKGKSPILPSTTNFGSTSRARKIFCLGTVFFLIKFNIGSLHRKGNQEDSMKTEKMKQKKQSFFERRSLFREPDWRDHS